VWNVAMDLATECYRISQMRSRPTPHAPRPTIPWPESEQDVEREAWGVDVEQR